MDALIRSSSEANRAVRASAVVEMDGMDETVNKALQVFRESKVLREYRAHKEQQALQVHQVAHQALRVHLDQQALKVYKVYRASREKKAQLVQLVQ